VGKQINYLAADLRDSSLLESTRTACHWYRIRSINTESCRSISRFILTLSKNPASAGPCWYRAYPDCQKHDSPGWIQTFDPI